MQNSTDSAVKKQKDALFSAVFFSVLAALTAGVYLWVRSKVELNALLYHLLGVLAVLDLGIIIPIWISYKNRLKEIQGGEEDAAAQY